MLKQNEEIMQWLSKVNDLVELQILKLKLTIVATHDCVYFVSSRSEVSVV